MIDENHPYYVISGEEVFRVEVHPRSQIRLDAVDNSLSDINFFEVSDVDDKSVSIKVAKSLEDLVDRVSNFNILLPQVHTLFE